MPYQTPFQYNQTVASTTWTINHGLGVYPIVDVIVDDPTLGLTKIIPMNVKMIDLNNIEIDFSTPRTGQARLV